MTSLTTAQHGEPLPGYPARAWYRRVPFLSTKPRPLISSFTDPKLSPEASANWFSLLTFSWLNQLLTVGYTRPLSQDDLYKLQDERTAQLYADKLDEAWERQCARAAAQNALAEEQLKRGGGGGVSASSRWTRWLPAKLRRTPKPYKPATPSLAYAMNDVVLVYFWTGGFMKLLADIGTITSPLLLRAITDHVTTAYNSRRIAGAPEAPPLGQGIGLALGLFLVQLAIVFLNVHSFYRGFGTGILLRAALIHATYRRAMKLSNRARVSGGLGSAKLVTLISSDVSRIDYCCQFFHMAWTSIIQIIICLALMVYTLGYSALPGFAFVLLLSPTQSLITRHLFSLRKRSMRWTDARVKGIAELLGGIRLLKSFAWEAPYLERIATLRAKELSFLRRRLGWRSANIALAFAVPTIAAVISFITYAATGHDLEAGRIFSALTFFQLLRTPLQFLPVSWNAIADATNAARRVAAVFEGETQNEGHPVDESQSLALDVKQASFEWDSPPLTVSGGGKAGAPGVVSNKKDAAAAAGETAAPARAARLDAITMRVKRGDLVMIVGGIGSGKSSLISAIAGEMRLTDGSVTLGGSVGMCAQSAWILSTTVRNNILFGKEYDEERYNRVVKDAQLLPDFAMLPAGDQTVVGEKGLSLSGGQRQRVNIARAVYHDDDVVLLDDCFSALDAHVGEAVFRQVLLGSLRRKTRILATHALHLLPSADYIYTLENGRIAEQGTYTQLMSGSGAFSKYVEKYGGANGGPARMQDDDAKKSAGAAEEKPDEDKEKAKKKKQEQSKAAAVMQAEERYMGSVSKHTYASYFGAGNLPLLLPLFIIAVAVFQGSTVMSPLWLLWWQQKQYGLRQGVYMGVYAALGVTQALGLLSMGQVFALFTYYSSATLHKRALHRIAHAPAAFFDTTPLGRITHRFSKDVDVVDNVIGDAIRTFLGTCVQVIGSIVLIAYLTPYFLIAVGVMVFLYLWTGQYYRTSGRELRRLDAVLRSQIYEHFSESISGVSTIRAYGEAKTFVLENAKRIDIENRAYWMSMACQRWLSIRLDSFGALLVLAVGMLTVGTRFTISPGETGVALSYILTAQSVWSWVIRQSAEIENNMSAVERLVYYADKVDMEPPHDVPEADAKLPANWPAQGEIRFDNVVAAHREGLPAVLKGISLTVGAGEHVAVCGRTGAGKSTLVTLTLRMMELSAGSISIDGVDIASLGLRTLRSNVSVIPQDALLFSGTLRYNLDPLGTRDDAELNDAMRRACLVRPPPNGSTSSLTVLEERRSLDNAAPLSLDTNIEEEGRNLSVGQRALVSMARALVRQTQIVILDEATASVDYSTDAAIQRALSVDMASRTLITVAHRLSSTLAYDRICMLDAGQILELGPPLELWDRGPVSGAFRQMCDSSNIARVDIERAQIERRALRVSNGQVTAHASTSGTQHQEISIEV